MALLEEAFLACANLDAEFEPDDPSPEFLASFPPTDGGDHWSGLLSLFDEPHFPSLGAELSGGNSLEDPAHCTAVISGTTDFQPWSVAQIIQRCCRATLALEPLGFEWAVTCSRPRPGEFGGGYCAIFADRVVLQSTGESLSQALVTGSPSVDGESSGRISPIGQSTDVTAGRSLSFNAPDIFHDPAFRRWLMDDRPKFTWHKSGDPDEWSDVVVLVDPSLSGEGSDSDMPAYIWDRIITLCRAELGAGGSGDPHIMVRLTNLDC
ncbi:MAG: hypothetical protein DI606_19110 [Sphingobium sp.]|nr:MAG: hypothetical protein DI606_19110 [Sphingobium sp.]